MGPVGAVNEFLTFERGGGAVTGKDCKLMRDPAFLFNNAVGRHSMTLEAR